MRLAYYLEMADIFSNVFVWNYANGDVTKERQFLFGSKVNHENKRVGKVETWFEWQAKQSFFLDTNGLLALSMNDVVWPSPNLSSDSQYALLSSRPALLRRPSFSFREVAPEAVKANFSAVWHRVDKAAVEAKNVGLYIGLEVAPRPLFFPFPPRPQSCHVMLIDPMSTPSYTWTHSYKWCFQASGDLVGLGTRNQLKFHTPIPITASAICIRHLQEGNKKTRLPIICLFCSVLSALSRDKVFELYCVKKW